MPAPVAVAPAPAPVAPTNGVKPVTPAAVTPEATFEVTVDGKPAKLTRRQLEQYAGKGAYADKVIRQAKEALAATKKADAERAERESIWDDDERLQAELEKRGKLDILARKRLAQRMAENEMTPDQRRIAELEADAAKKDAAIKAADEEKANAKLSESAKRLQTRIETELSTAAERVGLKRDEDGFFAVYESLKEFRDLGLIDPANFSAADADRVCEAAIERIDGGFKKLESAVVKGLKGKALYDRLGKSVVDELNRYQVELIRGGGARPAPAPAPAASHVTAPTEFLTIDEARAKMRALGGK